MHDGQAIDRRVFLKTTAAGLGVAAVGSSALHGAEAEPGGPLVPAPKVNPKDLIWRSRAATMEYSRLGRTNYMVSRIVAGIGGDEAIWRRMLAKGMNYFDTAGCYKGGNHELDLGKFFRKHRDQLWITTKASDVAGHSRIDEDVIKLYRKAMKDFIGEQDGDLLALHKLAVAKQKATGEKPDLRPVGKRIAEMYARKLDESLGKMKIEHVDCYMVHGIEIPWIFDCLELWEAYEKAHKAGKIKHFGHSVHKHHKEVLAATVEANKRGPWKIDLIMPGINPESYDNLKPELIELKKQDVGIVAMKTAGIANRPVDGREAKFKTLTGGKTYNEWEQAKLWMLQMTEGLIDACIAAMENNEQMEKDLALPGVKLTAEAKRELAALVKLRMSGTCSLCGQCETNCPENIAVTDMIRYHGYVHQYHDRATARELYAQAGYDPAKVCSHCGTCSQVCPSQIPITDLLQQLSKDMA